MLTPQETIDRLEIGQVIERYFRAMDSWDYDLLETVFTADAVVRYDALGEIETTYREMIPRFREFNRHFSFMQHLWGQPLIEVRGDSAESRTSMRAIHVQTARDGRENKCVIFGAYRDQHARTQAGWRIADRRAPLPADARGGSAASLRPGGELSRAALAPARMIV